MCNLQSAMSDNHSKSIHSKYSNNNQHHHHPSENDQNVKNIPQFSSFDMNGKDENDSSTGSDDEEIYREEELALKMEERTTLSPLTERGKTFSSNCRKTNNTFCDIQQEDQVEEADQAGMESEEEGRQKYLKKTHKNGQHFEKNPRLKIISAVFRRKWVNILYCNNFEVKSLQSQTILQYCVFSHLMPFLKYFISRACDK